MANSHVVTRSRFFLLIAALVCSGGAVAQLDSKPFVSISRCFFVYASIYEAGQQTGDAALRSYALQRLMYVRGFLDAGKTDAALEKVFKNNLGVNKRIGERIEENILRSKSTGDASLYNVALEHAEICDRDLSIKSRLK